MKKILFFGIYDPDYARNRVLISGFKHHGFQVGECRVDPRANKGFKKYRALWKMGKAIKAEDWDYILVAFPGQTIVPLARLLFPKEKLMFDAFLSLYDSNVDDRKLYSKFSPLAWRDWLVDLISGHLVPVIILDTNEHIKYFARRFGWPLPKIIRAFVGSAQSVEQSIYEGSDGPNFVVHFHGTYIPLQGLDYIVRAAKLLDKENVIFNLVGAGQIKKRIMALAAELQTTNVNFIDFTPHDQIPGLMAKADVCLGVFGDTAKALRVLPNKVCEALAFGCPLLTAATPGMRELTPLGEGLQFCDIASPESLAEAIRGLKNDKVKLRQLAQAGLQLYREALTPEVIVGRIISELNNLPHKLKVAVITPKTKNDYLCDTVLDGLLQLHADGQLDFVTPWGYKTDLDLVGHIMGHYFFAKYAKKEADLIIFCDGKNNINNELANKINCWDKTVFVDGSEVGKNRRFDKNITSAVENLTYDGLGAINQEAKEKCAAYFRREKPYLNNIQPLPFGIESQYYSQYYLGKKKDLDFVCIWGQEDYPPLRKEVREYLEQFCKENGFTYATTPTFNSEEFYKLLARAKVGVSIGGGGFDTARFWEILANNCLLLTEKVDIEPPLGRNLNYERIWQFNDLGEFKTKLAATGEYLKNQYQIDDLTPEYKAIIENHSATARVGDILKVAREKAIIK